jgi:hypothetical protein
MKRGKTRKHTKRKKHRITDNRGKQKRTITQLRSPDLFLWFKILAQRLKAGFHIKLQLITKAQSQRKKTSVFPNRDTSPQLSEI